MALSSNAITSHPCLDSKGEPFGFACTPVESPHNARSDMTDINISPPSLFFIFCQCHYTSLTDFVVSPPCCGPDEVDMKYQEGPLALVLLNYPDHGRHGNLPLQGKIPMVEPGIEPGTSCSVVETLTTRPRGWSHLHIIATSNF
jgi:hypothetical protein